MHEADGFGNSPETGEESGGGGGGRATDGAFTCTLVFQRFDCKCM